MIGLNILQVKILVLQVVLIIIFQESELSQIFLYLLKKYRLFIMLKYSLNQLLMRINVIKV